MCIKIYCYAVQFLHTGLEHSPHTNLKHAWQTTLVSLAVNIVHRVRSSDAPVCNTRQLNSESISLAGHLREAARTQRNFPKQRRKSLRLRADDIFVFCYDPCVET